MFACDSCDEAFTENRNLTRHITAVHNKKTFNCFHCDFVSNRKDNLARHIKSNHLTKRSADVLEMNSEPRNKKKGMKISASSDRGPRSRVCARETLHVAPIDVSGNFPAPMSAESPSKTKDHCFAEDVLLKKDR